MVTVRIVPSATQGFFAMLQRNWDPLSRPFDGDLDRWAACFDGENPVPVNFRETVGVTSGVERFTHIGHPYPAKLLFSIPLFFLNCSQIGGRRILDPFCGSGTVLVEGRVAGREVAGADTNPLARLIARAKATTMTPEVLLSSLQLLLQSCGQCEGLPIGALKLENWFGPTALRDLDRLASALRRMVECPERDFLMMCLSATIRKVSLADPRIPVPVRLNPHKPGRTEAEAEYRLREYERRLSANVMQTFEDITLSNIKRMRSLASVTETGGPSWIGSDARALEDLEPFDLVITSPPYGGAQKYIRACGLSLQILGLSQDGLRSLEKLTIGREHFGAKETVHPPARLPNSALPVLEHIGNQNPLRKHISACYLEEMSDAVESISNKIRSKGWLILVVGNNVVAGQSFDTRKYLSEICNSQGLALKLALVDTIRSRGMITTRNPTASVISEEYILLFQRQ